MSTTPTTRHTEQDRPETERRPAGRNEEIDLDPSALATALERRITELSERLHAMTTERSILADALRRLRAGQKSPVEIMATLAMRRISM